MLYPKGWDLNMELSPQNKIVNVGGHKMVVDRKDCLNLSQSDKFEAYEVDFIKSTVQKGWTVIDIGAHIGYHTITLSEAVGPDGTVYAFEPDIENHRLLLENLNMAGCKNVIVNRIAVMNRSGVVDFKLNPNNSGDNHIVSKNSDGLQVPCTSLDEFFESPPQIGFVKMDIQGAEYFAVKGMKKILKDQSPILMTEFAPGLLKRAGVRGSKYLKLLSSYGYNKFAIIRNGKKRRDISLARIIRHFIAQLGESRECNLLCFKETL